MRFIYFDRGHQLDKYCQYLGESADKFPIGAREFALADWHFDREHHQCPHDSWLEYLDIRELSSGKRNEIRVVEIDTKYFGAHHDGHFTLLYRGVVSYAISCCSFKRGDNDIGHGDWMVDEITMDDDNLVHHEIEFSEGGTIKIVCADFEYYWIPK
jgi:hypothetical protein